MEQRREDFRIYVVSAVFFSCIVAGGVFLGLYIFLPAHEVRHWYPTAGLILVGIPWVFWLLTYIYRCIRPERASSCQPCKPLAGSPSVNAAEAAAIAPPSPPLTEDSPTHSTDGSRHVHFGGVVVISDENGNIGDEKDGVEDNLGDLETEHEGSNRPSHEKENSVNSRESEMPLTRSISS